MQQPIQQIAEATAWTSVIAAALGWLPGIAAFFGILWWLMKLCIDWELFVNSKPITAFRNLFK